MKLTLEDRLHRAGHTLDQASLDYQAASPDSARELVPAGSRRSAPMVVTVAAAAVVTLVFGGVVLAARTDPGADPTSTAGPLADDSLAAAIDATRAAAAMAVAFSAVVEENGEPALRLTESWNYGAPDRWEQLTPAEQPVSDERPPSGVTGRLYVGDETWSVVDGRWVPEAVDRPGAPAPVALLDTLGGLDCQIQSGDELVAWSSSDAACVPEGSMATPALPVGTPAWAIAIDPEGRIFAVKAGAVVDFGADVDLENSSEAINRVGAVAETSTRFWYDGIDEVTGKPVE